VSADVPYRSAVASRIAATAMARERKNLRRHFACAVFLPPLIRQKTDHGVFQALTGPVIGFPVAVPVVVLAWRVSADVLSGPSPVDGAVEEQKVTEEGSEVPGGLRE